MSGSARLTDRTDGTSGRRTTLDPALASRIDRTLREPSPAPTRSGDGPGDGPYEGDPTEPSFGALLERHDPRAVASIEREIRRRTDLARRADLDASGTLPPRGAPSERWLAAVAAHVDRLLERHPALAPALATSGDGRVREAALDAMTALPGPFELALLLRRVADWVPEVRRAALGALERTLLDPGTDPSRRCALIADVLELVLPRPDGRRGGHALGTVRERLLDAPGVDEALARLVREGRTDRAPRLLRQGLAAERIDLTALASLAREAAHASVRRIALGHAVRSGDADALVALEDRSPEVRRAALDLLLAAGPPPASRAALERTLLDPRPALSDRAAAGLDRLGVDPVALATHALETLDPPPWAAARRVARGTGAHGARARERLRAALERLGDEPPRWLHLLAAAGDDRARERLRDLALRGPDESLAREAVAALVRLGEPVPREALLEAADAGEGFARRGLVALTRSLSPTDVVRTIARLEAAGADEVGERLWDRLEARIARARGGANPSDAELARLTRDLAYRPRTLERLARLLDAPAVASPQGRPGPSARR